MMMAAPLLFQGRLFAQEVDQNKSTPYTHQLCTQSWFDKLLEPTLNT